MTRQESRAGIVLLFIVRWYAGLIGVGAAIVGFNIMAATWDFVYRALHL
jgi:hypothetical protein